MSYIPFEPETFWPHPLAVILVVLLLVATFTFGIIFEGIGLLIGLGLTALAAIGTIVIPWADWTDTQQKNWESQVKLEVAETYGMDLSTDELQQLLYPPNEPSASFLSYGSIDQVIPAEDGEFTARKLTLIWQDGKMFLADAVANGFEPLETIR